MTKPDGSATPLPQLDMLRSNLEGLPAVHMPIGYVLRTFQDGDEPKWNALMDAAFERKAGETSFEKAMMQDPFYSPERVLVVEGNRGELAATASAWFRPKHGAQCGYVHWVATHPDHTGKKLGYLVSVAALHKMKTEGRTAAVLQTDDFRLPALAIYFALGFKPMLTHESHAARWAAVLEKLGKAGEYRDILSGPFYEAAQDLQDK